MCNDKSNIAIMQYQHLQTVKKNVSKKYPCLIPRKYGRNNIYEIILSIPNYSYTVIYIVSMLYVTN